MITLAIAQHLLTNTLNGQTNWRIKPINDNTTQIQAKKRPFTTITLTQHQEKLTLTIQHPSLPDPHHQGHHYNTTTKETNLQDPHSTQQIEHTITTLLNQLTKYL